MSMSVGQLSNNNVNIDTLTGDDGSRLRSPKNTSSIIIALAVGILATFGTLFTLFLFSSCSLGFSLGGALAIGVISGVAAFIFSRNKINQVEEDIQIDEMGDQIDGEYAGSSQVDIDLANREIPKLAKQAEHEIAQIKRKHKKDQEILKSQYDELLKEKNDLAAEEKKLKIQCDTLKKAKKALLQKDDEYKKMNQNYESNPNSSKDDLKELLKHYNEYSERTQDIHDVSVKLPQVKLSLEFLTNRKDSNERAIKDIEDNRNNNEWHNLKIKHAQEKFIRKARFLTLNLNQEEKEEILSPYYDDYPELQE